MGEPRSAFAAAASISPPGAATTGANTSRSASTSTDNQAIFDEGMEIVRRLWDADGPISHRGKYYSFDDIQITPKPMQRPMPAYVGSFSKPSIELAARLGCGLIVAPFAAAISYGGLRQVAELYHETCAKAGTKPGRLMCSYFTHFADNPAQERRRARAPDALLPRMRHPVVPERSRHRAAELPLLHWHGRPAAPGETGGPHGEFGADRPSARITEILKKVEAAGFDEVILYFNVGLKPHRQVLDEMSRFAEEVRPAFAR